MSKIKSYSNYTIDTKYKPKGMLNFNIDLSYVRDFGILLDYHENVSFRINPIGKMSYINIVDDFNRGLGRKYNDFPTISMNNTHLIDMAKLILQALEPESLIEDLREKLEKTSY